MLDEQLARIRTIRSNIQRYTRLLQTELTDLERKFLERRLAEERSDLETVSSATFPLTLTLPKVEPSSTNAL